VIGDPFAALGLVAGPELTDDDVRAAWRRVAAATHPDRADGGDPASFAVAAGAYSELRTRAGRGEALADLRGAAAAGGGAGRPGWARLAGLGWLGGPGRARWTGGTGWAGWWRGRAVRLGLRVAAAAGVSVLVVVIGGWQPAPIALIVGALTWVIRGALRPVTPRPTAAPGRGRARRGG
jgi:hypothetical protein